MIETDHIFSDIYLLIDLSNCCNLIGIRISKLLMHQI